MKKLLMIVGGIFSAFSLNAQSMSRQVVASAGTHFSGSTGQIDFTFGEVVTSSLSNASHALTQGFQQTEIVITSIDKEETAISFSLYPNPTTQFVTVETDEKKELQVSVMDVHGRTILESKLFNRKTTLDLQNLSSGGYIMDIRDASGISLHSYKLIKN